MNLKAIGLNIAVAATVMTGSLAVAPSAHAATVKAGDVLNFSGSATLGSESTPTTTLSFLNNTVFVVDPSASVFGPALPSGLPSITTFTIGDLGLTKGVGNTWSLTAASVPNWLTGLPNSIQYTLESFNLTKNGDIFSADYTGFFTPPATGTPGFGGLTSQGSFSFADGASFSSTITAVPTPALLPAALGMGAAALRKKRKQEADADLTPEPVEA